MLASSTLTSLSAEIAALAAAAAPVTVRLHTGRRAVSGFVLQSGVVATAAELVPQVGPGEPVVLETDAGRVDGTLLGKDPATDVAIIDMPTDTGGLPTAGAAVRLGEMVLVAARTRHGAACALAVVSLAGPAWESMRGGQIDQRIELDGAVPRRFEGGAVLTVTGALLGMAVFGPHRRVLVIPAATIARTSDALKTHGRIRRGYLGVGVQPVCLCPRHGGDRIGLMVVGIDRDGPAVQAGILQGDIVLAIGDTAAQSARDLHRALQRHEIGSQVSVTLSRGGADMVLNVKIGEAGEP